MNTRMEKYHDEEISDKRVDKYRDIYGKISEEEVDNLNLTTNVSIIDTDSQDIDVEKLKEILDKKYSHPKRDYLEDDTLEEEKLEDTKEYDLKKAIDEARRDKETDYEKDRYKKLRNSEYEILKSLNIEHDESDKHLRDLKEDEEKTLIDLIKTVNENALRGSEIKEELLDDLIGSSDTEVLKPINPELSDTDSSLKKPTLVEELEKTKRLSRTEILEKIEEVEESEETGEDDKATSQNEPLIANTFYTGKLSIDDKDLEDFKDLEKEIKSGSVLIKILVAIIILIVVVLGVYLLNKYLNLGLF